MRLNNRLYALPVLFLLLAACAPRVWAQSTDATIVGLVRDPSGASVAGVTVTATNVATNIAKAVKSNETGNYDIPALRPGEYSIIAETQGFKKQVITGIGLQVNQTARVDITLQLGEVAEQVTVEARALLVVTETGAMGQVIDNRRIVDLPLNGRNFTQLATLTPGVTGAGAMGTGRAQSVYVSGSRATKTEFILDGISANGPINGGTGVLPSVDALQEFKVQTSAFAAEFGRSPALVNVSIKAGTNELHGGVFHFVRNDVFDARHTFALANPPLKRNQFGFTLGGPVRRNDWFFFGSYEGTRQRRGRTFNSLMPSMPQRDGQFSNNIFDPSTTRQQGAGYVRDPFPNNRIPASQIAPQSAYFLKFWPEPNTSDGRYVISPSDKDNNDQYTLRMDKRMGNSGNLFGRYTISNVNIFTPSALPALVGQPLRTRFQNAALSYTRALRPTLLLETRLGYNREFTLESAPGLGTNHTVLSGITGFSRTSESLPRFPNIGIAGITGIAGINFRPLNNTNDIYQIVQTVAWFRGAHSWKAGVDLRQQRNVNYNSAYNSGSFSFANQYTTNPAAAAGTGAAFADFLLGLPASALRSFPRDAFGNTFANYHFFVQDDWRATPNLTVNLGVRYEFNPWPLGYRNQLTLFDLSRGQVVISSPVNLTGQKIAPGAYAAMPDIYISSDEAGLPRQLQYHDRNNFGPRVGFAWRVLGDNRTVLRGGYGIFYENVNGNGRTGGIINPPFLFDESATNNIPVPNRTLRDFFFTEPPASASRPIVDSRPIHQRTPYEQTWNLAIQRELAAETALEVGYLGKKGTRLERDILFNQPLPGPGAVDLRRPYPRFSTGTLRDDGSSAIYHGLQTKLEKRFSRGLTYLVAYTYSKSIDDVSGDLGGGAPNPRDFRSERGVSDFDFTHNLTISAFYELPFGPGKPMVSSGGGLVQRIAGGWQVGAIILQRSGAPFTPRISGDPANVGVSTHRPNRIGSGKLENPTTALWFNPADFTLPAQYTFGNSGRNILRANAYNNYDLIVLKNTRITEGKILQFRSEFFNAFNHANYSAPVTTVNLPTAGRVLGASDARILQFALKLLF